MSAVIEKAKDMVIDLASESVTLCPQCVHLTSAMTSDVAEADGQVI